MYLLDTNVISELRRREKADKNVVKWAEAIPLPRFFLSAVSILRSNWARFESLARTPCEMRSSVPGSMTTSCLVSKDEFWLTMRWWRSVGARLHVPDPRAERDAMIAATAIVHGLTIVTRNIADFKNIDVSLLNPWIAFQAGK